MARTNGDWLMGRIATFSIVAVITVLFFWAISSAPDSQPSQEQASSYPEPSGYVVDQSGVLSPETEDLLTNQLTQLNEATGIQMAVVTIPTTNGVPIEEYSIELAESWGVGDAEQDSGILFITATEDRQVRFEIGYGMEGALTDSQGGRILDNSVIPHFKNNNFEAGIIDGVGALIHHVTQDSNVN